MEEQELNKETMDLKMMSDSLNLLTQWAPTQAIQDCQTVEELNIVLDSFCPIVGSHKEYSAEKLKHKIDQLRDFVKYMDFDKVPWNLVTRTHGLRAKCMELLYYEKLGI